MDDDGFRSLVDGELAPRLATWAAAAQFPVRDVLAVLADAGCLGVGFPPEDGGAGGNLWRCVALHEALGRLGSSALSTAVLSHLEVGTRLVAEFGSSEAKARWLPSALAGGAVLGYAATEAAAGSDLAATTTSGRRQDGHWVIDGAKRYITNACAADALCVLVRTDEHSVTSHTLFLVPMDAPGVSVAALDTAGNKGTLGEVRFEHVRVADTARLGLAGQGLLVQIRRLAHERAFVAVALAAMAGRWLEGAEPSPSAAELEADVEEARLLAHRAVAAIVAGRDARAVAAMAKLLAARALGAVAGHLLQADRATDDDAVQRYLDALGFGFAGGTDNMLLEAIAR